MKNVRIYIQSKNIKKIIKSSATTWKDLREDIKSALGSNFDPNLKYTLVETRATLEQDEAIIPNTDVSIIGTPVTVKSGREIDLAAVIESLNKKIKEALDELKSEIEKGHYDTYNEEEGNADFSDLEDLANKIK